MLDVQNKFAEKLVEIGAYNAGELGPEGPPTIVR